MLKSTKQVNEEAIVKFKNMLNFVEAHTGESERDNLGAFILSVRVGDLEVTAKLVRACADIDSSGRTHEMFEGYKTAILKYLDEQISLLKSK